MEEEFLKSLHGYQNIIHKICKMYRDSKEDQEDLQEAKRAGQEPETEGKGFYELQDAVQRS